jgi:hypothetical protein
VVKNLTIYFPDVLPSQGASTTISALKKLLPNSAYLQKLLAKAEVLSLAQLPYYHRILDLCAMPIDREIPIAALTHPNPGSKSWLRADPVALNKYMTTCTMAGNAYLEITMTEQQQLLALCNDFLAADGLKLQATTSQQWYLELATPVNITTTPWEYIIEREILDFLPAGENQTYWRQLLTELQMLLYESLVNQQRRLLRKPTIDSLWFWGVGEFPKQHEHKNLWDAVWGGDNYTAGIASYLQVPYLEILAQDLANWQQHLQKAERILWVLPNLRRSQALESPQQLQILSAIDEHIFLPLLTALRQKKLQTLFLILSEDIQFQISATQMQSWWRKALPIG